MHLAIEALQSHWVEGACNTPCTNKWRDNNNQRLLPSFGLNNWKLGTTF